MADRQLRFLLVGKDKSASRTLQKVGKDADGLSKKFGGLGKAGLGALGALGVSAGGAVALLGSSIGKASDLGETLSKVNNVFGDSAKDIRVWSKSAARSFGISQQAALAAAGQYGDMFKQLGFTREASVANSKAIVKLAADLGSFHNVDPTDVLERIGGALRGEFDSLQALIPNINAARVETEALAQSGKKSAKELTAQEKAAATLAIVMKDSGNALNDFSETSGGLANQQRILRAQFDDTRAQIGQGLLPIMTNLATFTNDRIVPAIQRFVDQFTRGVGPGGEFKATLASLSTTAQGLWPSIERVFSATKKVVDFVIQHGGAFTAIAAGVGSYRLAMSGAQAASHLMAINGPRAAAGMAATGAAATTNAAKVVGFAAALSRAAGVAGLFAGAYAVDKPGGPIRSTFNEIGTGIKKVFKGDPGGLGDILGINSGNKSGGIGGPPKYKPTTSTPARGTPIRGGRTAGLNAGSNYLVLPDGKVLAELVNSTNSGRGARGGR